MIKKLFLEIKKYDLIKKDESILVGVSGGPDSMALLHALHSLENTLGINVSAAHINHTLRGEEADRDEEYVKKFCEELNISVYSNSFDTKRYAFEKKLSIEAAAREIRYNFYETISRDYCIDKVALAHNMNDQAETVIMNIIRGTGLDGLKGIEYKRQKFIRPLLNIPRTEIELYCKEFNLNPRIDRTNMEDIYTRNKIRLNLVPYINKIFNTDITSKICKMSSLIKDDLEYISWSTQEIYNNCIIKENSSEVVLSIPELLNCHVAAVRRVIRLAVNYLKGNLTGIQSVHIKSAVELALEGKSGTVIQLPEGIRIEKSHQYLKIFFMSQEKNKKSFNVRLNIPGTTDIEALSSILIADIETMDNAYKNIKASHNLPVQTFDFDKIKENLKIRTRSEGDLFKAINSNSTKTLKKYFIEKKIPKWERDGIPLIASEKDIIWIVGVKTSEKYKIDENTKTVLKLTLIKK